jgi:uncharacterized membrane protein
LFLLIGLVFTFITLAIPLQLEGNYITLFWSIESVLLLWLSQKSGFKIMKLGSLLVLGLMLISLIMDWTKAYDTIGYFDEGYVKSLNIILNKAFITSLISGVSLLAILRLLKFEKEFIYEQITVKAFNYIVLGLTIVVFYVGGLLEINYQTYHYFVNYCSQDTANIAYNSIFILVLLIIAHKIKSKGISIGVSVLSSIFLLVFLLGISTTFADAIYSYINGEEDLPFLVLLFRWIAIFAAYAINILLLRLVGNISDKKKDVIYKLNLGLFVFVILYLLSADLDTIGVLITNSKETLLQTQKTGYAVLWGISSFVLMIIGMKRKIKTLRILSLSLFAITLIKLFVYDLANISEGGKIIAFILLGVLLLIISFMYQKVKKLVIEDDFLAKKEAEDKDAITDNKEIIN